MFFTIRHLIGNFVQAEQMNRIITATQPSLPAEVDRLTITVLDEYFAHGHGFRTENGVSYLLRTGQGPGILFDVGFNRKNEEPSPLLHNMGKLGITPRDFDTIVISHNHLDHVGGVRNQIKKTFSISARPLDLSHVTAFTPVKMSHPTARVEVNDKPRELRPGVALSPPLPSNLFWLGWTPEQAVSVNVKGLGQVVVSGCGHPGLLNILEYFQRSVSAPVAAVVGGFHQMFRTPPHHDEGAKAVTMAKILGASRHPLDPVTQEDVRKLADEMLKIGVQWALLSPHDDCDGTLEIFDAAFDRNFDVLKVGRTFTFGPGGIEVS